MLNLVFCWHFHQPDYRTVDGRYHLPWTYLHAMKDYADMAAHLEHQPNMRAVVNFVPSLLDQLEDYGQQFRTGELKDPLLALLIQPDLSVLGREARAELVQRCLKLNPPTMLEPFPGFVRLRNLIHAAGHSGPEGYDYLSGAFLSDLVTWYHLAWTGESVRRDQPRVLELMQRGGGFSLEERRYLFDLYGTVITSLLPRYRELAREGRIELSSTPHSHPILPLLLDLGAAREARPRLALPDSPGYPGGAGRARAHVQSALAAHETAFQQLPRGCWPAEGGVSRPALELLAQEGIAWAATGEGVLRHTLGGGTDWNQRRHAALARPYRLAPDGTAVFFRDDHLSDLIGFEYKGWYSTDAVRHFLHQVEEGYRHAGEHPLIAIVLDGENAWEYFPYNGHYFLTELYQSLANHDSIKVTTFSDYLDMYPDQVGTLPNLVAGSWVYGDFTTWIGDPAKNRAWDLLCAAKAAYDDVLAEAGLDEAARAQAEAVLKSCESSDWFWWFGDYNPAESVADFDNLYRAKLRQLYQCLGREVPSQLDRPICRGGTGTASGVMEAGGVMRRGVAE